MTSVKTHLTSATRLNPSFSPDGVGSITHEEKEKFSEVKERLRVLLEYQITNFRFVFVSTKILSVDFSSFAPFSRFCFPFGRPEGALKATLSLLERVLMKDIVTPVPAEEVRSMIKKSLETAALVNYTKLSGEAKIEGNISKLYNVHPSMYICNFFHRAEDLRGDMCVPAAKKLEDLIHLAELCVDLLQQNDEHYAEVSVQRSSPTCI